MKTYGSNGPFGVDANPGFPISTDRRHHCRPVAHIAVRIVTEEMDREFLEPYNAIPLDNKPGVSPIDVGEIPEVS